MAPVYSACRLSRVFQSVVPVRLASVLFVLCVVLHRYHAVLTYDRKALFNIKSCMEAGYLGSCSVLYFSSRALTGYLAAFLLYGNAAGREANQTGNCFRHTILDPVFPGFNLLGTRIFSRCQQKDLELLPQF
ncbi:hypothetical protein M9458_051872 [Cirrhinus mrigala]|uniref:Uncharacterized protein n=1 Tax=Cirrhinus mrigala TaxID=683832 RepID=A0ABD0MVJ4_CIRMR